MTAYTFDMTAADTYATIYDSNDRPAATIRRPAPSLPQAMPYTAPDSPVMAAIEAADWMAPGYDVDSAHGGL